MLQNNFIFINPTENHEELSEKLTGGYSLSSHLVLRDHLASDLAELPEYATTKNHIQHSIVEKEALKEMQNSYTDMSKVLNLLEKWGCSFSAGNKSTEEEDQEFKSKLIDYFFEAETKKLYPEIIERFKEAFKYPYNEETEKITELSDEEFEKLWPEELLRILAPSTSYSWERDYSAMGEPFSYWDSRNTWQQFFFISPSIDANTIYYARGGSASSGQRHQQGLLAHTFALLSKTFKIPTNLYKFTSKNEFIKIKEFDNFKTMDSELSGNYRVDLQKTKYLFEGKLLKIKSYDSAIREFIEVPISEI